MGFEFSPRGQEYTQIIPKKEHTKSKCMTVKLQICTTTFDNSSTVVGFIVNITFTFWNRLHCRVSLRLHLETTLLCPSWLVWGQTLLLTVSLWLWRIEALLLLLLLLALLYLFQAGSGRWLMGTLGNDRELNRLFCSSWQTAGLVRVVISVMVWRAAAGVRAERLGANTAVELHCRCGQQVKLRLYSLSKTRDYWSFTSSLLMCLMTFGSPRV